MKRIIFGLIALVAILYLAGVGYLYANQRAFFFDTDGEVRDLAQTALDAEGIEIPTEDGKILAGWYEPPSADNPTILYLKGNTGSFAAEYERYEAFQQAGYGFLAFDYRGFPASPGEISQDHILTDALAAFDWLAEQGAPIVIWGRSLGASPATYVASERDAEALLLESPFYSAVGVAHERYPFVPVSWLMWDQFPTYEWMAEVEEPVMIAHGTEDQTISVGNAERLYAEVPNPHVLWLDEGANHGNLWERGIWERAQTFFDEVRLPPEEVLERN